MIEPTTLARPYARAAFEYARAADALEDWQATLSVLASVTAHERIAALLIDPALTGQQRATALLSVLDGETSEPVRNFVAVMADNDRLELLPEVVNLFALLKSELESVVEVDVTSAYDINEQETQRLIDSLSKRLNRTVNLTTHTDSSLLGGALIRAGDLVIDGSVRGRLEKLAGALTP